tara:strand:- start:393 stop:1316 length:924 start_codon:yes stop_codon:yes gene_type:complete
MVTSIKNICFGFAPALQKISRFNDFNHGEVNRSIETHWGFGGKGANTAHMLNQLGGSSLLIGFCGGVNGARYLNLLDEAGVDHQHISVQGETRICHTLIDDKEFSVTELVEEMEPLISVEAVTMENFIRSLDLSGVISISGKLPEGLSDSFYQEMIKVIKQQGGQVILDTQGEPLIRSLDQQPFVKLNRQELCTSMNESSVSLAAESLLDSGAKGLLVTDGNQTSHLFANKKHWEIYPPFVDAINPVGSGDAVTAGMVLGLERKKDLLEAVRLGMASGAANALQLMCGMIDLDDVERLQHEVQIKEV